MTSRLVLGVMMAAIVAVVSTGCLHTPPTGSGASPAHTQAATQDAPLVIRTSLSYTRPRLFTAVTRPLSFGLLADYHSAGAADVVTLIGAWDDATQTLTADVTITQKSENLVFVDDPAVAPESETPIRAGRSGSLPEVACPETVPAQHPCYLLQVLR